MRVDFTPEEEAAVSYFDFDDAALGKLVRANSVRLLEARDPNLEAPHLYCMSAALVLICKTIEVNGDQLRQVVEDVTTERRSEGDWEIIVRRRTLPNRVASSFYTLWARTYAAFAKRFSGKTTFVQFETSATGILENSDNNRTNSQETT